MTKKVAKKQPQKNLDLEKTVAAAAKRIGIRRQTLSSYFAYGCPGKNAQGLYSVSAIEAWRQSNIGVESRTSGATSLAAARAAEARARAAIMRLKLRRARGEVVPVHEIRQMWSEHILIAKKHLTDLPSELPERIGFQNSASKARCREIVQRAIDDALQSIHDGLKSLARLMRQGKAEFGHVGRKKVEAKTK